MTASIPSPSSRALIALPTVHSPSHSWSTSTSSNVPSTSATLIEYQEQEQWQPILHASNQVVLYNPRSHALSITSTAAAYPAIVVTRRRKRDHDTELGSRCPYCKQSLPAGFEAYDFGQMSADDEHIGRREENRGDQDPGRWHESRWNQEGQFGDDEDDDQFETLSTDPAYHSRASDYFQLLAIANETSTGISRSSTNHGAYRVGASSTFVHADDQRSGNVFGDETHRSSTTMPAANGANNAFPADKMAEGYFKTFFQEEYKLGMGANGSVFLCQHVLDGNPLGHFAVKKIAVGNSHSYLLKILKEVRLLERLHHLNIITYHHAWLESCQFSSFGPTVPTLHVLMQWAEGGSLDDFIDARLGRKPANIHLQPFGSAPNSAPASRASTTLSAPDSPTPVVQPLTSDDMAGLASPIIPAKHAHFANANDTQNTHPQSTQDPLSRSARIRAFRAYQHASPEEKERMRGNWGLGLKADGLSSTDGAGSGARTRGEWTAVHLLSADEVKSLFKDVAEGLRFLHSKSILHLDLKPGNVLLTWDEGRLIPRAMLSDFGTSRDMLKRSRVRRSGNTGTLEYSAPESLPSPLTGILKETDSKADMWSLGMILHKLLFFKLPYKYAATGDANGEPMSREEEGDKMEQLEREVLNYPGFKSNPNLVSGFEARKLPRAYLVLLENLLHKTPAARPSSERVATAIRDGKLDPLEGNITGNLPLTRPRMDTDTVDEPSYDVNNVNAAEVLLGHEKAKLLALPSPIDVLGPEEGSWRSWLSLSWWIVGGQRYKRWMFWRRASARDLGGRGKGEKRWQIFCMRVLRSCLLVVKISTIPRLCPGSTMRPRPVITAFLLGAALTDSVLDHDIWERSLVTSAGLALVHLAILGVVGSGIWNWPIQACCLPLHTGHT